MVFQEIEDSFEEVQEIGILFEREVVLEPLLHEGRVVLV